MPCNKHWIMTWLRSSNVTLQHAVHWRLQAPHHPADQKALVCGVLDYAGQPMPHLLTSCLASVMPCSTSHTSNLNIQVSTKPMLHLQTVMHNYYLASGTVHMQSTLLIQATYTRISRKTKYVTKAVKSIIFCIHIMWETACESSFHNIYWFKQDDAGVPNRTLLAIKPAGRHSVNFSQGISSVPVHHVTRQHLRCMAAMYESVVSGHYYFGLSLPLSVAAARQEGPRRVISNHWANAITDIENCVITAGIVHTVHTDRGGGASHHRAVAG